MKALLKTKLFLCVISQIWLSWVWGDSGMTMHEVEVLLKGNPACDQNLIEAALELNLKNLRLRELANKARKNSTHYFDLWVCNPADYRPFACRLSLAIKYNEIGGISSIDFIEDFDENKSDIDAYFSVLVRVFLSVSQYGGPLRIIGRTSRNIGKLLRNPEAYVEIAAESGLMKILGVDRAEMFKLSSKVLIGLRGIQKIVFEKCGSELKNFDLVGGLLVKTDDLFGELKEINNNITEITFINCQMGGNMLKNLKALPALEVLQLNKCKDVNVEAICVVKFIEKLILTEVNLSKDDFISLAKILIRNGTTVVNIDLSKNQIEDIRESDLHWLVEFCKIQQINLADNPLKEEAKLFLGL